MGSVIQKIEIEIKAATVFELKPKKAALIELSKLDNDVLQKLAELSRSKNAIEQLRTNFSMIKGFLS